MHSAPALTYRVRHSRVYACSVALIALAVTVVGSLWLEQMASAGWRGWLYLGTSLTCLSVAAWGGFRVQRGDLHWDGQAWSWSGTAALRPVSVQLLVHADFLIAMVLGLCAEDGQRFWLWPERSHDPSRWMALRRAVFSPQAARRGADAEFPGRPSRGTS